MGPVWWTYGGEAGETPVARTKEDACYILGLPPGAVGRKYREQAAALFSHFLIYPDPDGGPRVLSAPVAGRPGPAGWGDPDTSTEVQPWTSRWWVARIPISDHLLIT